MPEYLAPGVYVEETSFRPKTIEGVSTSTAAFIGPTRTGPTSGEPELITSFADFERIYGGMDPLTFDGTMQPNFMAHAVRAFFNEGGKRCYVVRVFSGTDGFGASGAPTTMSSSGGASLLAQQAIKAAARFLEVELKKEQIDKEIEDFNTVNHRTVLSDLEGLDPSAHSPTHIQDLNVAKENVATLLRLEATQSRLAEELTEANDAASAAKRSAEAEIAGAPVVSPASSSGLPVLMARFPGAAGNMRISFVPRIGTNVLVNAGGQGQLKGAQANDTVLLQNSDGTHEYADVQSDGSRLSLIKQDGTTELVASLNSTTQSVKKLTVDVLIERPINRPTSPGLHFDTPEFLEGFTLHRGDGRSLHQYFKTNPDSKRLSLLVPFAFNDSPGFSAGASLAMGLFNAADALLANTSVNPTVFSLTGGTDGALPAAGDYEGSDATPGDKTGFKALEDLEDVSIVAAPGYSFDATSNADRIASIQGHLITHCEKMKYRIAVLDAPNNQTVSEVREFRSKIDSKYAALYYPWVSVLDPITRKELNLPPSGFVSGIYARNDVERGVQKAPANEVVRSAIGFEFMINRAQQEVLNPEGVNCFRFLEGRGYRLWGARTATSDGEWKYVNLRRYFAYMERSIEKGTQVYVFESNGERLWANVQRTVSDFLYNEWSSGRLMGLTPDEAFFVRCDRSTMTQNDIDNGRLICLIGVAPLRPAEFVIFRIGQKLISSAG